MIPISPNPDCDDTLDWLWPATERAQVPVVLGATMFLPTVGKIAERHPGFKLIVDHMGVPRASKGEAAYRFQPELLAVAKLLERGGQSDEAGGATPRTNTPSAACIRTRPPISTRFLFPRRGGVVWCW